MALLLVLKECRADIAAAYFHHGKTAEKKQQLYRDRAALFCEKLCFELEVPFYRLDSPQRANSEAGFRKLRYGALQNLQQKEGFSILALGHHQEDLLETRLLRLIRGTGKQGLTAMAVFKETLFRPFLDVSKLELIHYVKVQGLKPLADPSNESVDPLRNWLRKRWLPQLEKRQPGGAASLARSLALLASEGKTSVRPDLLSRPNSLLGRALARDFWLSLGRVEQKRLLAQYLLDQKHRHFTQSHLEEICKRLDNPQKVFTFKVARLIWVVNAQQIEVQSSLSEA